MSSRIQASLRRKILRAWGHQFWLRKGVRERLLRILHNCDTARNEYFSCPFYGLQIEGNFSSFIDWQLFYFGAYAKHELELSHDILASIKNPVIFDIGANVGNHTLFFATCCAKVFSFEPFEPARHQLDRRVKLNSLDNVEILPFGLGEKRERILFQPPSGSNLGTGTFVTDPDGNSIELEIWAGDDFVQARADIERVDVLKIDVEGFEPKVLAGLKKTIQRFRPVVLFEWSEVARHFTFDFRSLLPHYTFYKVTPPKPLCIIFARSGYNLTQFLNSTEGEYLAIPEERNSVSAAVNLPTQRSAG